MGFKIGEIVRRKDGDGRPHKIVDIKVYGPLNSHEHTFFQFIYEDGGSDCFEDNLEYYKGDYEKHKKNKGLAGQ